MSQQTPLSSRGALSTNAVLSEIAGSLSGSPHGGVVLLSDVERCWAAVCKVLRAQLLQDRNVFVTPRGAAFYFKRRLAVQDGDVRYYVRLPHFGFVPSFVTTFALDAVNVPHADAEAGAVHRLPLDYVAAEAKLPAEVCATVVHEVFRFVGEALFKGSLVQLTFDGLATVLVKRERASVTFSRQFCDDVFAIDSRKWPAAIRERVPYRSGAGGQSQGSRPASSASSAGRVLSGNIAALLPSSIGVPEPVPLSARSANFAPGLQRPKSMTPASLAPQDQPAPPAPHPRAWVSAAPAGKTFAEIDEAVRKPPPKRAASAAGARGGSAATKARSGSTAAAIALARAATPRSEIPSYAPPEEEESVYDVIAQSPQRHVDVAEVPQEWEANDDHRPVSQHSRQPFQFQREQEQQQQQLRRGRELEPARQVVAHVLPPAGRPSSRGDRPSSGAVRRAQPSPQQQQHPEQHQQHEQPCDREEAAGLFYLGGTQPVKCEPVRGRRRADPALGVSDIRNLLAHGSLAAPAAEAPAGGNTQRNGFAFVPAYPVTDAVFHEANTVGAARRRPLAAAPTGARHQ